MAEWLLKNQLILLKTADTNWRAAQLTCIQKREGNERLFGTLAKTSFLSRTNHTLKAWDHTWKSHKCEVRSSEGISRIKSSHLSCLSGPTLLDSLQSASRVLSARHEIQHAAFKESSCHRADSPVYFILLSVSVSSLSHHDFLTIYSP